MKLVFPLIVLAGACLSAAEPNIFFEDSFDRLSSKWSANLGSWTAKDGILHGFESGSRRHGPSIHRDLNLAKFVVELDFRMNGGAERASIGFNRGDKGGHLCAVLMAKKGLLVIAHPANQDKINPIDDATPIAPDQWHHIRLQFLNDELSIEIDGNQFKCTNPCFAETKATLGLGGSSGGPEGESIGSLDFRNLKVVSLQ